MAEIAVETSEAQEAIKNLVLKAEEKEGGGEMKEEVTVKTENLTIAEGKLSSEKDGNEAQDELKKGDCENKNPSLPEAAKKNKKKKKKAAAVNSGENGKEAEVITDQLGEGKKILGEINLNTEKSSTEVVEEIVCAFCKKPNPTKRCSKRHPKCLKKMFCNETCEALAHEDKKAATVKKQAASKAAAAKKATKVKNWKNTDSGQFWWHDQ